MSRWLQAGVIGADKRIFEKVDGPFAYTIDERSSSFKSGEGPVLEASIGIHKDFLKGKHLIDVSVKNCIRKVLNKDPMRSDLMRPYAVWGLEYPINTDTSQIEEDMKKVIQEIINDFDSNGYPKSIKKSID